VLSSIFRAIVSPGDVVVDGGATVTGAVPLPPPALHDGVASALPATSRARAFSRAALLEVAA